MRILSFDYVDAKGDKTHRKVLVALSPSENYLTYDLTGVDSAKDIETILNEFNALHAQHMEETNQLLDSWGLSKIRAFKPERMSNVVSKCQQ